ncbi:hypothetical protein P9314_07055 [Paenibacillus validus]|uniref:hypothetical protein n=1 Tax=Paenibacillus TaxID=44249 RepID=UPI000FDB5D88|nr:MULTISPECIES: hypothetical protein [Paenibacillus]MED4600460.1 hypothetical protein [Paenibacillus validus]MED4604719.1 hypothetical protein [Paenibacillus validus]
MDSLIQLIVELLPDKGSDFVVAGLLAIIGFFIKGYLDKRKSEKESRESAAKKNEETEKKIKEIIDAMSPKYLSIPRDIIMHTYSYNFINEHVDENGFKESPYYKDTLEMKRLTEMRMMDDIEEILSLSTSGIDGNYAETKNVIQRNQNTLKNLKNVLKAKSDDDLKVKFLGDINKQLSDDYQKLMNEYWKLAKK